MLLLKVTVFSAGAPSPTFATSTRNLERDPGSDFGLLVALIGSVITIGRVTPNPVRVAPSLAIAPWSKMQVVRKFMTGMAVSPDW